jgi:glycosyltransferase involved in cell wall biosynthesis
LTSQDVEIDILVPFYGDPQLMKQAVASVRDQDLDKWRLIVVDDAFPDPSIKEWFEGLCAPRVHYFRNNTNLGANANYRRALNLSSAKYVVFMGADDIMLPNYLSTVRAALAHSPEAAVVQPGVRIIDESGIVVRPLADRVKGALAPRGGKVQELRGEQLAASLLAGNWTYFPSLCFERAQVERTGFRREFNVVQDLAILIDLALAGATLCYSPEIAFSYRRHRASDSAIKGLSGVRFEEEAQFFRLASDICRQRGWHSAARVARLRPTSRLNSLTTLPSALKRGRLGTARRLLSHSIT